MLPPSITVADKKEHEQKIRNQEVNGTRRSFRLLLPSEGSRGECRASSQLPTWNTSASLHTCSMGPDLCPVKSYRLPFNAWRYIVGAVIRSFRRADAERLFRRESVRRFRAIERQALRKLDMLDAVTAMAELATPPGNRLEKLHGNREGQHSIRINDQWRICFMWRDGNAYEVEIVDYH